MTVMSNEPRRATLNRSLSSFALFSLAFGTIIGVGWVTVLGAWVAQAGSAGAMIAFLGGALAMLPVALCYAEIAGMYPVSGGEFAYLYELYGERFAFVMGWLLVFLYIAITAFEAISVGWLASILFPQVQGRVVYHAMGSDVTSDGILVGLSVMAVVTLVNYLGGKSTAAFQHISILIMLAATLVFVGGGLWGGQVSNLQPYFSGSSFPQGMTGVLLVLATTPFWYGGFDTIPQAMGEVSDPTALKRLPHIMTWSIGLAALFYILIILTACVVTDRDILLGYELPLANALEATFHTPLLRQIVLVAGLCGLITTWNAVMFSAARIVFALGRARMIPSMFGNVHPRFGSPANAVLFVGMIAGLGSLAGRNAISVIVGASALIFSVIFMLIVLGVILLRKRAPHHPRPFKLPGGILGLSLTMALAVAVFALALVAPIGAAQGAVPVEWMLLGGWLVAGLIFYVAAGRLRRRTSKEDRRKIVLEA